MTIYITITSQLTVENTTSYKMNIHVCGFLLYVSLIVKIMLLGQLALSRINHTLIHCAWIYGKYCIDVGIMGGGWGVWGWWHNMTNYLR